MDYFSINQQLSDSDQVDYTKCQQQLAEIFLLAIPLDRRDSGAGKVMVYLAQQALRFAKAELQTCNTSTKSIHIDVGGNPNQEPSAWLSPIWKEIESKRLPEITPNLIQACVDAGLDAYPVVVKEKGKHVNYRLGSVRLPADTPQVSDHSLKNSDLASSGIVYKRDLSLKLSVLGRLLFSHESNFTFRKRFGFLTGHVLLLVAVICFEVLLLLLLGSRTQPLSAQDVVLILMGLYVPWVLNRYQKRAFRLFEDRLMLAPDWALSWAEVGATIEINRSAELGVPAQISVNRYTSVCPLCSRMVKLDRGDPDYPRRVVGRCEEHPREHVFTFDRSSLIGERLR